MIGEWPERERSCIWWYGVWDSATSRWGRRWPHTSSALGFALISPIPLDIGALEVSGVGALLTVGVSEPGAVGVILLNRALRTATPLVMALVVFVLLRDELRAVLGERSSSHQTSPMSPTRDPSRRVITVVGCGRPGAWHSLPR